MDEYKLIQNMLKYLKMLDDKREISDYEDWNNPPADLAFHLRQIAQQADALATQLDRIEEIYCEWEEHLYDR